MLKILTLSAAAWDDANSLGNTYSNLFTDWESAEFTNIYARAAMPDNRVCTEYYRITETSLVKNLLKPEKIGEHFTTKGQTLVELSKASAGAYQESRLIALVHKFKLNKLVYVVQDWIWFLKGWQNERYEAYLRERDPDIIFTFAIPTVQIHLQLQYLRQITNAPIVVFLVDNVCGEYLTSGGKRGKGKALRLQEIFGMADKIYAISDELKDVYSQTFGTEIEVLRKGCSFEEPVKQTIGKPVRIIYAGNLLYRRLDVLAQLTSAIEKVNGSGQKILLEIYSGTPITQEQKQCIQIPGASEFRGSRPFEEIQKCLAASDIVLHVESFDKKQMDAVRYSFSTKITDALESGSAFLVIGPKGISSVEYPRRIPGVMVVDDVGQLEAALQEIAADQNALLHRAHQIREYALDHHSLAEVRRKVQRDFQALCDKKI